MSLRPFSERHIGPDQTEITQMLGTLGVDSLDALMDQAVPDRIRSQGLSLPGAATEEQVARELRELAEQNNPLTSLIGLGYHATITPPVIRRNVLEDPSWYTAYTPYQPEISQGRLEALLNFQTMIGDLTGLPVANASLLDEGTAAAEAMTLVRRSAPKATGAFLVDAGALPQSIAVINTRAGAMGIDVEVASLENGIPDGEFSGVLIQYPTSSGRVPDLAALVAQAKSRDMSVVVAADLLALTLLEAPGTLGADIVVGSAQRFGVPLFYGGPHAGYMSVRKGLERHLPGRLVGVSVDADGRPAYRLALQTREQHIRRDRATSNICTAQVLLAITAAMYAVYHGPDGLKAIAMEINRHTRELANSLREAGLRVENDAFFDTITVEVPGQATRLVAQAHEAGFHIRLIDTDHIGISVGEGFSSEDAAVLLQALDCQVAESTAPESIPEGLLRTSEYLTHDVFNTHRSETSMLRYLRRLSARDYALDRGMIPLGSCTMKLNATTEMEPISLPGFANLHPFAPTEDAQGYLKMISQLEAWLAEVTGYDQVSIQPNAGSQGELAGLMAIRGYHQANGDSERTICLIPASAHGTNAASAVMAGMKVVVVKTATDGSVDMDDLRQKCSEHAAQLAAIMVTYPSTHGAYEESISDLCQVVHEAGGQVYVDGANLNALLGYAKPGEFGGDVSHLNLHKTFCIPHGGGGPGVGPVAVKSHLAPFLPSHPSHPIEHNRSGIGPISAAPFGSAGILPISWAYVRLMGAEGLTRATAVAVLSANYLAQQLEEAYPVLYRGHNGWVAHECILDLREISRVSGVSVDDVAKRLIDYGFHAPTMSFPVAGTLMVEPTESESIEELDRFVAAMTMIRAEIGRVESGEWEADSSVLRGAPHTADVLNKALPYDVGQAVFPTGFDPDKYWPPVRRIDQAFGDRNLVCACPPPEAFAE
jgi:glycine dehydrogenase